MLLNAAQIREADRIMIEEKGYPGILLMENAGRLAAANILKLYPQANFCILIGPGNNGGDGWVIARHLYMHGREVRVVLSHPPKRFVGDAKINYLLASKLPILIEVFSSGLTRLPIDPNTVIIDALLGTGIVDPVRDNILDLIQAVQTYDKPVVAIDLPSGLNSDSGHIPGTILSAHHTLTFQWPKVCHYVAPARFACGKVQVLDIGIWPDVLEKLDVKRRLLDDHFVRQNYRHRTSDTHKGKQGHVLVIGGSEEYAGAIALTAYSALKAGTGLCTVFCPAQCKTAVSTFCPEAICRVSSTDKGHLCLEDVSVVKQLLIGKSSVVIGPGMGMHQDTKEFFRAILPEISQSLLIDADGLNILSDAVESLQRLTSRVVLSPHPGEMARLTGLTTAQIQGKRLETVEEFVHQYACTLLLKGPDTIVASTGGNTYVNTSGNPGMAKAGSGDVLSGVIGALLARNYDPAIAAALAVYLHGKAGDLALSLLGMEGILARDIANSVALALHKILV